MLYTSILTEHVYVDSARNYLLCLKNHVGGIDNKSERSIVTQQDNGNLVINGSTKNNSNMSTMGVY